MGGSIWIIITVILALTATEEQRQGLILNEFIRHFEPLFYQPSSLSGRYKRDYSEHEDQVTLHFSAHGRLFKLRLRNDNSVFSDDVIFENSRGPITFDVSKAYSGVLEDDDEATVTGVLTQEGLFDGTVSTRNEDYYIEPASRYFPSPAGFHSVIYKGSDVLRPDPSGAPCLSEALRQKQHESKVRTRVVGESAQGNPAVIKRSRTSRSTTDFGFWYDGKPTRRRVEEEEKLNKRSIIDPKKTTCMLYLQADHLFYQKMGSEEACIETMTRHVQRVNNIYKVTDFDQDGYNDNLSFMIKRIKVYTKDAVDEKEYRFPGNYGVEKFLELFSEEDYDAFCLAYMFTYRDFEGGTLGLAWTGDLKNAGGVCEKNGHYRGSLKSLNTGIVTLLNYGKHVPPAVSHVTLAHEIGHNFGSPHDPEHNKVCTPGGDHGNYIMFARATSGDKENNQRFSPCSLRSINAVLNAKARDPKGCFVEPQTAICGNGVVEQGEECDCGWEEDCEEECCFPMRTSPPNSEPPCSLRPNKRCSPSQGPCCTADCHLKSGDKCRDDNGCRDSSFCDGHGPSCPPSTNKPNKTICNEEFVCFKGECTGSICLAYGLESCQCVSRKGDPPTKACELCCKLPGENQPCLSSFEWNSEPYNIPDLYAKPGTPCNNYIGYCDVFQKCREVDPVGPLSTLRKLLLSDEGIASLQRFATEHWYAVILIVAGLVTILLVIIKVFGKKAQETLKKITIIHSSTTPNQTFRLPQSAEANVHVHPVKVRKKLPLKKKVREYKKKRRKAGEESKKHGGRKVVAIKVKKKEGRVRSPSKAAPVDALKTASPSAVSDGTENIENREASSPHKLTGEFPTVNSDPNVSSTATATTTANSSAVSSPADSQKTTPYVSSSQQVSYSPSPQQPAIVHPVKQKVISSKPKPRRSRSPDKVRSAPRSPEKSRPTRVSVGHKLPSPIKSPDKPKVLGLGGLSTKKYIYKFNNLDKLGRQGRELSPERPTGKVISSRRRRDRRSSSPEKPQQRRSSSPDKVRSRDRIVQRRFPSPEKTPPPPPRRPTTLMEPQLYISSEDSEPLHVPEDELVHLEEHTYECIRDPTPSPPLSRDIFTRYSLQRERIDRLLEHYGQSYAHQHHYPTDDWLTFESEDTSPFHRSYSERPYRHQRFLPAINYSSRYIPPGLTPDSEEDLSPGLGVVVGMPDSPEDV